MTHDFEGEQWREISGYEGLYAVSNMGRVKSIERMATSKLGWYCPVKEKILKPVRCNSYLRVCLCKEREKRYFLILSQSRYSLAKSLAIIKRKAQGALR